MGMDPSENSDNNYKLDVFVESSDNEDTNIASEMKIIDTNIEKCIAELKKSFENLTTNMVLVQSADQVKYKR